MPFSRSSYDTELSMPAAVSNSTQKPQGGRPDLVPYPRLNKVSQRGGFVNALVKQTREKVCGSIYRCMHRYLDRSLHGWMDGWMDGRMDGWMDGPINTSTHTIVLSYTCACVYMYTHARTYACIRMYVCIDR